MAAAVVMACATGPCKSFCRVVSGASHGRVGELHDRGGGMPAYSQSTGLYGTGNTINYTYDVADDVLTEATAYTQGGYSASIVNTFYAPDIRSQSVMTPSSGGGSATTYTYHYDPDNELTQITSLSGTQQLQFYICYDADGRRETLDTNPCQTTCASSTGVCSAYGYDADSRLIGQAFKAGGNSLGSLSYKHDLDDNLIAEYRTLAAINMPSGVPSIGYSVTNQVSNWNGAIPSTDAASNLQSDPTNGAAFTWDERGMLSTVNGGPAGTFWLEYDAKGRVRHAPLYTLHRWLGKYIVALIKLSKIAFSFQYRTLNVGLSSGRVLRRS